MAKKGGGSAPAAPDPAKTAAAQGAINKETAIAQSNLNQVNEYTPYGSSVYTPTGEVVDGITKMQRTTTLSPEQQAILDQQTGITSDLNSLASDQIGRVNAAMGSEFTYDGMPAAPTADANARQQTIDAIYNQFSSRLDPRFEQEQRALETKLINQGLQTGTDAFNSALESFGRTKNDAYTSAQNQAVAAGGAEQSRLFGLQANERERAIQEEAYRRNIPLNEIAALLGTGTGVTNPQFSPTPQSGITPADITGPTALQYQGQMNAYNQKVGTGNAAMGGLFGLGSSIGGGLASSGFFSDRRVKRDIRRVGRLDNGLDVYAYRYVWGGPVQIGLLAQEVEKLHPAAVGETGGIKTVDYAEAVK